MATAFVTGGSGFLGRNLIAYLVARGWQVRAIGRSEAALAQVKAQGAEAVSGDLTIGPAVKEALRGCDVVFHSAASTADWGDAEASWEANVTGTERLLSAAREAGVPRFVHVSTEAVLVDGAPLSQVDETRPLPAKPLGLYARTKGAAETRVLAANQPGFATVVVRPRFIWGKGDTSLLPGLVEATRSGALQWFSGGMYLTSTCNVTNVCEGMLKAHQRGEPGAIYFLTDGAPVPFREMVSRMLKTQGVEPPTRSVPAWLIHAVAYGGEALYRLLKVKRAPPITHALFHIIGREVTVSDAKARRELGYAAEVSIEQGLREMAAR